MRPSSKLFVAVALVVFGLGAFAPTAEAGHKKGKRYTMEEICGNDEACRAMVHEMLKRPRARKIMAREAAKDPAFQQTWQEEGAALGRGG